MEIVENFVKVMFLTVILLYNSLFAHRSHAHFTKRLLINAYSFPLSLV